jgi:hypothetical protein
MCVLIQSVAGDVEDSFCFVSRFVAGYPPIARR